MNVDYFMFLLKNIEQKQNNHVFIKFMKNEKYHLLFFIYYFLFKD
jgi:hypothetical protein